MSEGEKSSKVKQLLKNTSTMSKIMLLRVYDFFDFLSIKRDQIKKENALMDMKDLLVKFKEIMNTQKMAKKATFTIENKSEQVKQIRGDFSRILQVSINIMQCIVQIGMVNFTIEISYDMSKSQIIFTFLSP